MDVDADEFADGNLQQVVAKTIYGGRNTRIKASDHRRIPSKASFEVRWYDDEEIARLASIWRTPETDPCVILDGPTLEVCFEEVQTPHLVDRCAVAERTA